MLRGRPRKLRIKRRARNKALAGGARGAKNPAQILAAIGRERVRKRKIR